jgi:hypothetical protein
MEAELFIFSLIQKIISREKKNNCLQWVSPPSLFPELCWISLISFRVSEIQIIIFPTLAMSFKGYFNQ